MAYETLSSLQRRSETDTAKPSARLRKSTARLSWSFVALLGALILVSPHSFGEASPKFPVLTGRVIDEAQRLGENDERELVAKLKAVEDATSDQLVVVTLPSLQPLQGYSIEDYSYQLSKHWGMSNKGVLLVVAGYQPRVRIEIGQGLKTILTDKIVRSIIEEDILPSFRKGYYAEGIKDGVNAIFAVLTGEHPAPTESGRPSAGEGAAGWYDDKDVWHWASGPRGSQLAAPTPRSSHRPHQPL